MFTGISYIFIRAHSEIRLRKKLNIISMLSAFISAKYFRNYLSIRLQSTIIYSIYNGITKCIPFGLETPLVYFFWGPTQAQLSWINKFVYLFLISLQEKPLTIPQPTTEEILYCVLQGNDANDAGLCPSPSWCCWWCWCCLVLYLHILSVSHFHLLPRNPVAFI